MQPRHHAKRHADDARVRFAPSPIAQAQMTKESSETLAAALRQSFNHFAVEGERHLDPAFLTDRLAKPYDGLACLARR